jgi:hypothetical protein
MYWGKTTATGCNPIAVNNNNNKNKNNKNKNKNTQ